MRHIAVLDAVGEASVIEALADGATYGDIAKALGVTHVAIIRWIRETPQRFEAARRARGMAADAMVDGVLDELQSAESPLDLAIAKERAAHIRWLAKYLDPERYGERVTIDDRRQLSDEQLRAKVRELLSRIADAAERDT